jgi:hypothetical protein
MAPRRSPGALLGAAASAVLIAALALAPQAIAAPVPDPPGTAVLDPAHTMPGGLWLDGRRLVTGDSVGLSQRWLGAPGPVTPGPWQSMDSNLFWDFCNGSCYYIRAAGSKTAYATQTFDAATSQYIDKIVISGRWGVLREFVVHPIHNVQLVAMTPSLLAYRLDDTLKLYDIDNGHDIDFPRPAEMQSWALDRRTVWTPSAPNGPLLIGEDVDGGQIHVTLPETCPINETVVFQVVNRWLAWGCSGLFTIYKGVVNIVTGVNKPISGDDNPRLGDGFLVQIATGAQDGGWLLQVIDFTKTPPTTTNLSTMDWGTFAQLSPWDGIRWAIDRSGGQVVAWVEGTEAGKIHVIPLNVPTSELTIYSQTVPAVFTPNFDGVNDLWHPVWEVSKPARWTLTLRRNGLALRTLSGDSYGSAITPEWNGMLRGWARWLSPVGNGFYQYTLTMTPADGNGPGQIIGGTVQVADAPVNPAGPVVPRKR